MFLMISQTRVLISITFSLGTSTLRAWIFDVLLAKVLELYHFFLLQFWKCLILYLNLVVQVELNFV